MHLNYFVGLNLIIMVQNFEINELKENKKIFLQLKKHQHVSVKVEHTSFNGKFRSKTTWIAGKYPVLEIVSLVPGVWRIITNKHKIVGYTFHPKTSSPSRWKVIFS